MSDCFFIGFSCAVIGFTFVYILFEPGELLGRVPVWIENKLHHKYPRIDAIAMKLINCPKCFSGQLAFWLYPLFQYQVYDLFGHIFTICLSITTAYFITLISNKLE